MPLILLRRRRALFVLAVATFILLLLSVHRRGSLSNPRFSRKKLAGYFDSSPKIDEIYCLIHLVISGNEDHLALTNNVVDSGRPVHPLIYADGKVVDWENEVQRLNTDYPIIIFGERYCPFSRRVKKILSAYDIAPIPYTVELDLRKDASIIRAVLNRLTHRATLPNVLVRGKSIGGSDELLALHNSQKLEQLLREAGAVVKPAED